ncbi:hypothetical protein FNE11_00155 [Helicobacter pylori]|uniref:hypothetical protein n=1 Tax=Helicobacter pylori TaxID=210 RepID=UPI000D3D57EE|nr:hypothetical protein [Helicobacter pylori]PUD48123.1 hypothetical protein C2R73_01380 [Helicobacter pylori]PUD54698.1 hypothetical protein C2R60_01235 [Helicobacter pylori]WRG69885.1 hypothetical protein FNE13_00160 [Helicobacter pylori]WRG75598.1 hypothetical protein FNE11_00155 [Helicobacter pylori]
MLLNYDFLEFVDEPQRNNSLSLTASIDKALADRKLARQNKPRVRIKGGLSLRATLDAFGEELSRLKREQNTTIKGSTIESTNLNSIVNKIKSGLPFGTISAFRVFKDAFYKDFTEKEQNALIYAYKSGADPKNADIIAQYWLSQSVDLDPYDPIKVVDFFHPQPENGKETTKFKNYKDMIENIYATLYNKLGNFYADKFFKKNATMRDLMSSDKFVERYRYTRKENMARTQQLKDILNIDRDFIGYIEVLGYWKDNPKDNILPDKEVSFFVFQNEPSSTFDLKNHLLIWGKQFRQAAICYGGQLMANKNKTYRIDLISSSPNTFGEVWAKFTGIKFSVPSDLPQSLTRINDSVYTFLSRYKEGIGLNKLALNKVVKTELKATCMPYDYSKLGIESVGEDIRGNIKALQKITRGYGHPKEFFLDAMIERQENAIKRIEARKCAVSDDFKQGMKRNIEVNNLVKAMRQGKKVSRTLLAKVLANTIDTDAGYCFISDLATQLNNISPRLSKSIVTAIEQAEGVRLTYALIDKVTYNSLHNILSFIFDIDNPLSDQDLQELVIEVPREALKEALKNVKLPQIKNVLTAQIFDGAYHFRN